MEEGLLRNFFAEARILVILAECRSETCDAEFKAVGRHPEEGSSDCSSSRTGMVDCPAFGGCVRRKSPQPESVWGLREVRAEGPLGGQSRPRGTSGGVGRRFCLLLLGRGRDVPCVPWAETPHAAGRAPMHAAAPATVDVSRPQVALVRGREALEDVGAPHARSSFSNVKWCCRV